MVEGPRERGQGPMVAGGTPSLGTHRLQQVDVLPQGADTAAEGDEEGEDADHHQQDGRVHRQAPHCRICHSQLSLQPPPRRSHPSPTGDGHPGEPQCSPLWDPRPHLRASAAGHRPPPPPSPLRSSAEQDRAGVTTALPRVTAASVSPHHPRTDLAHVTNRPHNLPGGL